MYATENGTLLNILRGHSDEITSTSFGGDKKVATGSSDKYVIVWSCTDQKGILKYSHSEPIVKVQFHPSQEILVSCTKVDFGYWTPTRKKVLKYKINPEKIRTCAWSSSGLLGIGMESGLVSIRDVHGYEIKSLNCVSEFPIWSMIWVSKKELVVGSADKKLTFIQNPASGGKNEPMSKSVVSTRNIGFYPSSIVHVPQESNGCIGGLLLVSGSNKSTSLFTQDGTLLKENIVTSTPLNSWISDTKVFGNVLAIGQYSGAIRVEKLYFDFMYALHHEKLVYRKNTNLTDLVIMNLDSSDDQTTTTEIKLDKYIQNLAIYHNNIAVLTTVKEGGNDDGVQVLLYQTPKYNSSQMRYELKHTLDMNQRTSTADCNCFAITSSHILITFGETVYLYNFESSEEQYIRQWNFNSQEIIQMKVIGGKSGREVIIVATPHQIIQFSLHLSGYTIIVEHSANPIKSFSVSQHRREISVLDVQGNLLIYNTTTDNKNELVFHKKGGVNNFAYDSQINNSNRFVYHNVKQKILTLQEGEYDDCSAMQFGFPTRHWHDNDTQDSSGIQLICFQGDTIYYFNEKFELKTYILPQEQIIFNYLKKGMLWQAFHQAASSTSVPVSQPMWKKIGYAAMFNQNLDIARKCFSKMQDLTLVDLVDSLFALEETSSSSNQIPKQKSKSLLQAHLLSLHGEFQKAAKLLVKINEPQKAVDLYIDLKYWEEAKLIQASTEQDQSNILIKQAEWTEYILGDWIKAYRLYVKAGEPYKAMKLILKHEEQDKKDCSSWQNELLYFIRTLPLTCSDIIQTCGNHFVEAKNYISAQECFTKIKDYTNLIKLYTLTKNWTQIKLLVQKEKEFLFKEKDTIHQHSLLLPYAKWLAFTQFNFDDSIPIYRRASKLEDFWSSLKQLIDDSVMDRKFEDVSHYYWVLEREEQKQEQGSTVGCKSSWYYAYQFISSFCDEPFTNIQPETVLQAAIFLLNSGCLGSMSDSPIKGISPFKIWYTIAKQSFTRSCFKTSKYAYQKLREMAHNVPFDWQDKIELETLLVQSKQSSDENQDLLPYCYRCGHVSSSLLESSTRDQCMNCGHVFIRCFGNFDALPLVEFIPHESISDTEAIKLIQQRHLCRLRRGKANDESNDVDGESLFQKAIDEALQKQSQKTILSNNNKKEDNHFYIPVIVDRKTLESMNHEEVFILPPFSKSSPTTSQFYKNMDPEDFGIVLSKHCRKFFHEENFELKYLKNGCRCPISRAKDY